MTKKILIPLPRIDFDPSEAAIPWQILTNEGFSVVFATPNAHPAVCDQKMLTGESLGIFSSLLKADHNAQLAYKKMSASKEFQNPLSWDDINHCDFQGLILPGGHAKGMIEYLESDKLKALVSHFFQEKKPVGAICHGVVLVSRSLAQGQSVLFGKRTTALLRSQELSAWALTCLWLGDYYRTYDETVESEIRRSLKSPEDFISGPLPLRRDSLEHLNDGFTCLDGHYLSARWPGDAHKFGLDFVDLLRKSPLSKT